MKKLLVKIFASGFGAGYFPFASGTAGTLVGVVIYYFLDVKFVLPAAVLIFIFGVYISTKAEKLYKKKDSGRIVIDEIAGYLFSMAFLPKNLYFAVAGFILFRIFDVWKPSPARESQEPKGGWGVMTDDLIAGIYTNVTLWIGVLVLRYVYS
ncbi:MAG: phosphatidylglycerophosphatase A [Candidatus Firestonebacteria bacterium]